LIRAEVAARFFAAHARGDARIVIGRASDFYGPGGLGTHFGEMFWREALTKGTAPLLVNPETPHAYTFTLDVAAALAALGEAADDGVTGRWWVLPTAPAEPTRALVARFARALGRELRVRVMPPLMRRIAGLFVPVLRELEEMLPSWEVPYALDDGWFRERFALPATPPDEGARLTLEWARARFADAR
jgi:nucleoside-diphosphate-sugar epimerase